MEEQDLYHVFVDFKKSFDRVCHEARWSSITLYNNNANLIRVIENLYNKATSAVYLNGENRRLVQNHSRSQTRLSALTDPFQHLLRENYDGRSGRSQRNS